MGDAFYVDFVAHEIRHEFGPAIYNGVGLNCGPQISPAAAYERGFDHHRIRRSAGRTTFNPQRPYFHFISVAEIQYSGPLG